MEQYLVWTLALMGPGCSLDTQKGWYVLYTVLELFVTHIMCLRNENGELHVVILNRSLKSLS